MITILVPGLWQTDVAGSHGLYVRCLEEPFLADILEAEDYVLLPKRVNDRQEKICRAALALVEFWNRKLSAPMVRDRALKAALREACK